MNGSLLDILCCPQCRGDLMLTDAADRQGRVASGTLRCGSCSAAFPVVRSIPRFVPVENYAANFGFQWNRFRRTQLDSFTGVPISRERLFATTGWSAEEMRGKRVLDVGCGAGRFAEVSLSTGARVVAVDYSSAADACFENLGSNPSIDVVQADIYRLPFKAGSFDFVYCLGVLQHTPDVKRAFMTLPLQLKSGGRIAVDVYPKIALNALWPKYWLRPITKRLNAQRLFAIVNWLVPFLLPLSRMVAAVPRLGAKLRWFVPVANYGPDYPQLSRAQIKEWAVLDTFDMFGPAYDSPQDVATLRSWFEESGLSDVEVFRRGQVLGRGRR